MTKVAIGTTIEAFIGGNESIGGTIGDNSVRVSQKMSK
jgi:hypothetical protein